MLPLASGPLGATLPDSARRKPSEIPSQTRSVSAFLPGRVSVGPRSFGQFRSRQHGSLDQKCRIPTALGKVALAMPSPTWSVDV